MVDCILTFPGQLFYNTQIPACIWFISRKKSGNGERARADEVLFIDAKDLGHLTDRTHKVFSDEDIVKVTDTYHQWKSKEGSYQDIKGFCKSEKIVAIEKHDFVLTPGRYVGIPDEVDDGIPFADKMKKLTQELDEQMKKEEAMNKNIKEQLKKLDY